MHMSANRLGLRNAEEVYLGRVLWLAARELRSRDDVIWGRLRACGSLAGAIPACEV